MSRAISSYPKQERNHVITRRLAQKVKGLGYWAAFDARKKQLADPIKTAIKKALVKPTAASIFKAVRTIITEAE